ncbi:MAG: hypothetical protein ACYC5Q_11830 [Thermoleophilia bacterium]
MLSPEAAALPGSRSVAQALAGAGGGPVVDLASAGVRNLRRRLSAAEAHSLRKALLGLGPGEDLSPREPWDTVVGYVCTGRPTAEGAVLDGCGGCAGGCEGARGGRDPSDPPAGAGERGRSGGPPPAFTVIAVSDHANLTWESPLTGPNDDRLGPRFPVTAGMYAPERVTLALAAEAGVVAGVWDERRLSPFVAGVVGGGRFAAVSAELASVAVVAAHLGYRVAAAVLVPGAVGAPTQEQDDTGRPSGRRP